VGVKAPTNLTKKELKGVKMKEITIEMVEKYLLGDFDVAKEILLDLADGTYTVENWRADLLKDYERGNKYVRI